MGIFEVAIIVMIVLKLLNVVELTWLETFIPMMIEIGICLLVIIAKNVNWKGW